ncbi:ester cyclase [Chitinophaga flava]|uniref:ABM domain-containing protein n=1 Tax=Chitinophaga flava TaxID=2259036 RepID=A0A365Y500_9BACT|nr:ester cyclase [Chitinophaga flava]RBL93054.1 hypothetical protein DF182_10925 [Chitinophaga flava]
MIKQLLGGLLLIATTAFSQQKVSDMETIQQQNKAAIIHFYEDILNQRKFAQLDGLISLEYANSQGGSGIQGFIQSAQTVLQSFPDAQWSLSLVMAEGDKVFVKQTMQGTHQNTFQHIAPTHKAVTSEGTAIYTFKNGKIISHEVQTDRLGFLQQLGAIPADITSTNKRNQVYFIDKFIVPSAAISEFTQKMNYNRTFIQKLEGFMGDKVFQHQEPNGQYSVITVATWKNQECLDNAKTQVQAEYKRIGFNPAGFYQQLHIQMERGIYQGND